MRSTIIDQLDAVIKKQLTQITAVIGDSDPSDPSYQATPHNSNYNVVSQSNLD